MDNHPEASKPDQQTESERFKIGQPSVELGQVLIGQCADFRTATHLLCLTRAWAAIAADDTTWKPLATLIAREAKLYLPATKSSDGSWRAECGRLFGARGTFVTNFASQPTPEPERTPFGIAVGCRFRPPGGTTSAKEPVEQREVVLPLHQRLRLIASAHHCSLAEARKRLWAPQAECALDPWATAAVAAAVATASESKENQSANLSADEEASAAEDGTGLARAEDDEKGEASGAATRTESAAGLIALQGGRAIVCAPGAGIRAFEFEHTFAGDSSQLEVWPTRTVLTLLDQRPIPAAPAPRRASPSNSRGAPPVPAPNPDPNPNPATLH